MKETPQQPELTSDDSLRFSREASKYGQEVHGDQCPGSVYHAFRDGAKYATIHERAQRIKLLSTAFADEGEDYERLKKFEAAAQARIKELDEKYKDLWLSVQTHFQTLIARNYNNIGKWHHERQQYNFELIKEIESIIKHHHEQQH